MQLAVLQALGAGHIEVRSAWDINIVDLDDDAARPAAPRCSPSAAWRVSAIASPIGKVDIAGDAGRRAGPAATGRSRAAHRLGARYIRIFSFYRGDGRAGRGDPRRRAAPAARPSPTLAERERRRAGAREREGHLRRHPGAGARPRSSRSARRRCGSPGTTPTSSRSACGRSPTATRCCARTWTTCRSRTRSPATGEVVPAGEGDGELLETADRAARRRLHRLRLAGAAPGRSSTASAASPGRPRSAGPPARSPP